MKKVLEKNFCSNERQCIHTWIQFRIRAFCGYVDTQKQNDHKKAYINNGEYV